MKTSFLNRIGPARRLSGMGQAVARGKLAAARILIFAIATMLVASPAFAQASSPTGGLGAQLNSMSSEAINSGGEFGGMAMYVAAIVCFIGGVWAQGRASGS